MIKEIIIKYVEYDDEAISFLKCDDDGIKRTACEIVGSIVRCKECKWHNTMTKGCNRNPCVEAWYDNDFCSYGERREE